jgi:acid phosphatase family membrane protein YuiD
MTIYVIAPFFAWFVAGLTKFSINSIKAHRLAFDLIGYGGLPSTHSSIVSCAVVLLWIREGAESPALLVALTLAFIVILDASSLRRHVGEHAEQINKLNENTENYHKLRERIGHTKIEVLTGIVTGSVCAYILHILG